MTEDTIPINIMQDICKFKDKTFVIKYGGSIMKNTAAQNAFIEDISDLVNEGINIVIVHGGGPEITKWLDKSGVENKFINGLRVTDNATMEIVEMVLSGSVNKKLVANLNLRNLKALGLSGRDCKLITAKKKYTYENNEKIDIGFVGEVTKVNHELLYDLINKKYIPVISPIGCDDEGNTYNINADFVASAIASELKADKLIILTDIEGVYSDINDKSSLIKSISVSEIKALIKDGTIKGGMIPKMECCMEAVQSGTNNVHLIDGRKEHSIIIDTFTNCGTKITA